MREKGTLVSTNHKPFYGSFTEILSGSETESNEFSREFKWKIYLFNNSKNTGVQI